MNSLSVAVVGTGLMGKGIGHTFAAHNCKVYMYGRSPNHQDKMYEYLDHEVEKNRLSIKERQEILDNMEFMYIPEDYPALCKVDVIIETVKEDKTLKLKVLKELESHASSTCILASNTSTYSITELGSVLDKPERFLGLHFISPVPLIDLVEIIRGYQTTDDFVEKGSKIVENICKKSFVVSDSPGFIINRLLVPFLNEASIMMSEGIVESPEVLDEIMKRAMNLKKGPLELADLIGLDSIFYSMESLYYNFSDSKYRPSVYLKNMVNAGHLGRKSGRGFYNYE
ncbi:3-hydroxyacyl-CoA dehydrogenase family protein [Fusibacter sp. JL216-2]|uniref:3-hydroxyacyl-CoA dehydrogenase family protein n=1 Tax=Fusibacter sp. JL216-2 TaxID=3071453 RepID=UPI003D3385F0